MRYYSIQPKEMDDLGIEELIKMNTALDIFTAQDMMNQFKISSFPHMDKKPKQDMHREIHKIAHPDLWENKPKMLTLKDLARVMSTKGN